MTPQPYDATPVPHALKSLKKAGLPVILFGVVGICLILLGSHVLPFGDAQKGDTDTPTKQDMPGAAYELSVETYREALEARIADICTQVAGVGQVRVIVSLAGGFEYVYAYDEKVSAAGTSRVYVTLGSGSSQKLVFLTERAPAIIGIGVVADGGGEPSIRNELTALLSSTFGIPSNRIYITGRG